MFLINLGEVLLAGDDVVAVALVDGVLVGGGAELGDDALHTGDSLGELAGFC